MLYQANRRLEELAPRYQLMRVPNENLAIQVIDREMGDEIRPVQSLSGGETFLASLALALGLSRLSARDLRIESLFIDEGFGSLDVDTLDVVIDTLDTLQETGRQVGVISHVPGLAERLGLQVRVEPRAAGLSEVSVVRPR
ncbi:MAG: SbcC/MukB-like Walker B domain-containing protein [bacterium]